MTETHERLVVGATGLDDDDRNSSVVGRLDDESVVGRRVLQPRTDLARDLELVPGAGRARTQVDRPTTDHLPHLQRVHRRKETYK